MEKCLTLHRAWSQALVAHQQKFDALANFGRNLLKAGIMDLEKALGDWDGLKDEERAAYAGRAEAEKAYLACIRRRD